MRVAILISFAVGILGAGPATAPSNDVPKSPAAVVAIQRAEKAIADAEATYKMSVLRAKRVEMEALKTALAATRQKGDDVEAAAITSRINTLKDEIEGRAPAAGTAIAPPKNVLESDSFTKKEADAYLAVSGFVRRSSIHNPNSVGVTGRVYDGTEDVWERKAGSETTRIKILYLGSGERSWAQPDHVTTK